MTRAKGKAQSKNESIYTNNPIYTITDERLRQLVRVLCTITPDMPNPRLVGRTAALNVVLTLTGMSGIDAEYFVQSEAEAVL